MTNIEIQDQLAAMQAQIDALHNLVTELLPANKLPPVLRLSADETTRMVKLRADLFHNTKRKKGVVEWRIKLFVWFDHKRGKQGHIKPLMFDMARVGGLDIRPYDQSPFATIARNLSSDSMIGCLTHRGPGTKQHKDHIALLSTDKRTLMIGINEFAAGLGEYEALQSKTPNAPVGRWYWNKEQ